MKHNKKIIFAFLICTILFVPLFVDAKSIYAPSLADYGNIAPSGFNIDAYKTGNKNFVKNSYLYSSNSNMNPVGVIIRIYQYQPPKASSLDKNVVDKGELKVLKSVLLYNQALTGENAVNFYTYNQYSYSSDEHHSPYYNPANFSGSCSGSHTLYYDSVYHYSYSFPALDVSVGSDDLKFSVDQVIVHNVEYDTKKKMDDAGEWFYKNYISTKSELETFTGHQFNQTNKKLKNVYYSLEPVYIVYKNGSTKKISYTSYKSGDATKSSMKISGPHTGTYTFSSGHTAEYDYDCVVYKPTSYLYEYTMENQSSFLATYSTAKYSWSSYGMRFGYLTYNKADENISKHQVSVNGQIKYNYFIGPNIKEALVVDSSESYTRIRSSNNILYNMLLTSFPVSNSTTYSITYTFGIRFIYYQEKLKVEQCRSVCGDPNTSDTNLKCALDFCDNRGTANEEVSSKNKRDCLVNNCGYKPKESIDCTDFDNSNVYKSSKADGVDFSGDTDDKDCYCGYTNSSRNNLTQNNKNYRGSYAICERLGDNDSNDKGYTIKRDDGSTYNMYNYSDAQTYINVACKESSSVSSTDISDNSYYPGEGINYTNNIKTQRKCEIYFDYPQWEFDYMSLSTKDVSRKYLLLSKLRAFNDLEGYLNSSTQLNDNASHFNGGGFAMINVASNAISDKARQSLSSIEGTLPTFGDLSAFNKANRVDISSGVTEIVNNSESIKGMLDVYNDSTTALVETSSYNKIPRSSVISSFNDGSKSVRVIDDYDFKILDSSDPYWPKIVEDFKNKPKALNSINKGNNMYYRFFDNANNVSKHYINTYEFTEGFETYYSYPAVCVSDEGKSKVSLKNGSSCVSSTSEPRSLSKKSQNGYESYFTSLNATPLSKKTTTKNPYVKSNVSIKKTSIKGDVLTASNAYLKIKDTCTYKVMGESASCSIGVDYKGSSMTSGFYNLVDDNTLTFKLLINNNLQDNDTIESFGIAPDSASYNNSTSFTIGAGDVPDQEFESDRMNGYLYNAKYTVYGIAKTKNGKEIKCSKQVPIMKLKDSERDCTVIGSVLYRFVCPTGYYYSQNAGTCLSYSTVPKVRTDEYSCTYPSNAKGSDGKPHYRMNYRKEADGNCYTDICYRIPKYSCETPDDYTCVLKDIAYRDTIYLYATNSTYNITATDTNGHEYTTDTKYNYVDCLATPTNSACSIPNVVNLYSSSAKSKINNWIKKIANKVTVNFYKKYYEEYENGLVLSQSYSSYVKEMLDDGATLNIYVATTDKSYMHSTEDGPVIYDTVSGGVDYSIDKTYITSTSNLYTYLNNSKINASKITISSKNKRASDLTSMKNTVATIYKDVNPSTGEGCSKIERVEYEKTYKYVCPDYTFEESGCRIMSEPDYWFPQVDEVQVTTSSLNNSYDKYNFSILSRNKVTDSYYFSTTTTTSIVYVMFGNTYCTYQTDTVTSCPNLYGEKPMSYRTVIENYCSSNWYSDVNSYSSYIDCVDHCSYKQCPDDPTISQSYAKLEEWCKKNASKLGYESPYYPYCVNNCFTAGDGDYIYRPININNPFPYSPGSSINGYISGKRATGKNWVGLDTGAKINNVYGQAAYALKLTPSDIRDLQAYNQEKSLYEINELEHSNKDSRCKNKGFCSKFVHNTYRDLFYKIS